MMITRTGKNLVSYVTCCLYHRFHPDPTQYHLVSALKKFATAHSSQPTACGPTLHARLARMTGLRFSVPYLQQWG